MRILVNGVHLYFDVEGSGLRPDGDAMREHPTLVLLHGGPGVDHSLYKPDFSALADVAQVVYLDHRGNGRSGHGPRESWTLAQWADDVKAFCDALGIVRPVVYGASFGGMVAMAYATRHPSHPGRLVLASTAARAASHAQAKVDMFRRPGGEGRTFDLLSELDRIACPTLVMGGRLDPMLPIECQRDIAGAIRADLLTYREFDDCGHGIMPDVPHLALPLLREFIGTGNPP